MTAIAAGDVLAVRSPGFAGAAIRLGAALLGRPNLDNHIAVVHHQDSHGTWWAIEGRPGGVGWVDASGYLASRWTITNADQPKTPEQRSLIAKAMIAMIGTRYDWDAIVDDGLTDLHLWAPRLGQVHGETVCSALAAYGYDRAKCLRPKGAERLVQPGDWDQFILTRAWESAA